MTLSRDIDLFREMSDDELKSLTDIAEEQHVKAGEVVLRQGVPATAIYIVAEGSVRVTAIMAPEDDIVGQDEEMLVSLKPGEFFGELSFITADTPSLSIIAEEPTRLIALSHLELNRLISGDAPLCRKLLLAIMRTLVARLRSTGRELVLSRYFLRGH